MGANAKHAHAVGKAIRAINARLLTEKTDPAVIIREECKRNGVVESIVRTIGKFPK